MLAEVIACIVLFLLGYYLGILQKGFHIHIHKEQQKQEKSTYNESLVDLLPNNVKQYYHENSGQNRF